MTAIFPSVPSFLGAFFLATNNPQQRPGSRLYKVLVLREGCAGGAGRARIRTKQTKKLWQMVTLGTNTQDEPSFALPCRFWNGGMGPHVWLYGTLEKRGGGSYFFKGSVQAEGPKIQQNTHNCSASASLPTRHSTWSCTRG